MLALLRVAPVPATPLLTDCGRSDSVIEQGRDEEQGFSGPNKKQDHRERADKPLLDKLAFMQGGE
jgi:hypothetical protein